MRDREVVRPRRRCGGVVAVALLAALLAPAAWAGGAQKKIGPRPLSEAERAAVGLAAAYLDRGPEAWWDPLEADSPLRALGREAALAEIGVRAGPRDEAEWQLQTPGPNEGADVAIFSIQFPSGVDETLVLGLARAAGGWKIRELRSLADPAPPRPQLDLTAARAVPAPPMSPSPSLLLLALAALVVTALAWRAGSRPAGAFTAGGRRPRLAAGALAGAVSLTLLLTPLAACHHGAGGAGAAAPTAGPAAAKASGLLRLGELLPLRRALAAGTEPERIATLFAAAPTTGTIGDVVRLWRAEQRLWRFELREVEKLLQIVPVADRLPLAALLRGRLALFRGDGDAAETAYRQALELGPDYDGLRTELAVAQGLLDDSTATEVTYELAGEMGSRLAEVYYSLAEISAIATDLDRGEELFRTAWSLQPVEREVLFRSPALAFLAARPTLFPVFGFSAPGEPQIVPPDGARHPLILPAGATETLAGGLLRISVGDGRLTVPGGWELAAADAPVEDAAGERRRREERALAQMPALVAAAGGGILAHPRWRQQAADAALALARKNRWRELVTLTDGAAGESDYMPPVLARLRALALRKVGREGDAKKVLVRLAKHDMANRRRDPGSLAQLAELFAASGDYDVAIKLLKKARAISPYGVDEARIRQLDMDRELAASYESWHGRQFDIRYPRYTGEKYAHQLDIVLTAERERLHKWIPLAADARIEVNLFPVQQFLSAYATDLDVVGIYDGKVRVPFADLQSLHPALVRILSHELAHAMIGGVTHDQAPHWFQEGMAQHLEMGTGPINPIPDLASHGRILAFPVIEPILTGFSEPQLVDLAYSESAWAVHFIEARYGIDALHRLLDAFARGLSTEEALPAVLRMTPAEFDHAAWDWCRRDAPAAWTVAVRRYDEEYDSLIQRYQVNHPEAPPPRMVSAGPAVPSARSHPGQGSRPVPDWYKLYAARAAPVKQSLATVLPALQKGTGDLAGVCGELSRRVRAILADPQALAAPEPGIAQPLRAAFERFSALADDCRAGDLVAARGELSQAEHALGRAATALGHYGLKP